MGADPCVPQVGCLVESRRNGIVVAHLPGHPDHKHAPTLGPRRIHVVDLEGDHAVGRRGVQV